MDDFESSLSLAIDSFVALKTWSQKPESSRDATKVFPIILDLDSQLKLLRHANHEHPLQPLAREVRSAFDTREFRAILLAAFNWRSGHRRKPALPLGKPQNVSRIRLPRSTAQKNSHEPEDRAKFVRDFLTFLESMRRKQTPLQEHVDIFRAGRRLPGSYGSTQ
jgi:hypothetical protein